MSLTKFSSRSSICACSDLPTNCAGVCSFPAATSSENTILLITAHQIGTVFDRASGMLLPRLVESTMMHLTSSIDQRLTPYPITISILPIIPPNNIQHLQIQPPRTEAPLSLMPVRALEVSASAFAIWWYIPTAASFIGDEGEIESIGNALDEKRVVVDGG